MKNKDKYEVFSQFNKNLEIVNLLPYFYDDFGELLEGL